MLRNQFQEGIQLPEDIVWSLYHMSCVIAAVVVGMVPNISILPTSFFILLMKY